MKKEKERIESIGKNLRKEITIGIDLSLDCPGIAVYHNKLKKILYVDSYPNKPEEKSKYFRYLEIKKWLEEVIKAYNPYKVIVEEAFMNAMTANSNVPLLNLHGFIIHYLQAEGMKVFKIMPSSARAYLKIKPNNKEGGYEWVKENYPFIKLVNFKKDNDKSDAVILVLNDDNEDLIEFGEKRKKKDKKGGKKSGK